MVFVDLRLIYGNGCLLWWIDTAEQLCLYPLSCLGFYVTPIVGATLYECCKVFHCPCSKIAAKIPAKINIPIVKNNTLILFPFLVFLDHLNDGVDVIAYGVTQSTIFAFLSSAILFFDMFML